MTLARNLARDLRRDIQRGIAAGIGRDVMTFTYASLAAAESSGDEWITGDTIAITGGATFIYQSSLASNYSGLIHRNPYGDSDEFSAITTLWADEATNTDPDTWSTMTDISTAAKGTDYELDTNGGRWRVRSITGTDYALLRPSTLLTTSDNEAFMVLDDLQIPAVSSPVYVPIFINTFAYDSVAAGMVYVQLVVNSSPSTAADPNWQIQHTDASTFANTGKTFATARRVFVYCKRGKWAAWFDGEASPAASGTVPRTAAFTPGVSRSGSIAVSVIGSETGTIEGGNFIMGSMTTA